MFVNRRTFIAKNGHSTEAVSMLKEGVSPDYVSRIYRSHYGRFSEVVLEMEFASMEEMERAFAEWNDSPAAEKFMSRWEEINESGGTNEVWILE